MSAKETRVGAAGVPGVPGVPGVLLGAALVQVGVGRARGGGRAGDEGWAAAGAWGSGAAGVPGAKVRPCVRKAVSRPSWTR